MIKVNIREHQSERIRVNIRGNKDINVKVNGQLIMVGDYEHYEGEYEVTPTFNEQKLETKNKVMGADVDVKPITVVETPNNSGGLTVIIGG